MSSTLRRSRLATAFVTFLATLGLLIGLAPTTARAETPTGSISGTISDSLGGVAGAWVYVYLDSSDSYATAVADSNGGYTFANLPDGTYRVFALELSHHLSTWYGGTDYTTATGVAVTGGSSVSSVNISMTRLATLTGTVHKPDGSPAAGVQVSAWMVGHDGAPTVTTDSLGQFNMGLQPSTFIVQATPANTYPIAFAGASGATSKRSDAKSFTIGEDDTATVNLTLLEGTTFSGALTSDASPVSATVTVIAWQENGADWTPVGQGFSDGSGHYRLPVGAGHYYLRFSLGGTALYVDREVMVASGRNAQTLNIEFLPLFSSAATPTISGTAKIGSVLTANPGAWTPTPDRFSYQWLRNGVAISGAAAKTYTVTAADAGKTISVNVTATKAGYCHRTTKSAATATVPAPPLSTITGTTPKITGTAKVGKTLKIKRGTWSPSGLSFSYQWYRSGKAIKGATKSSYKVTKSDKRKYLTVTVTAKRTGYTTLALTSKKTSKVR